MKKEKQQGITLIALIITIIVMLILVGVTINVALNGGLFEKGKTAATKTEEDSIYEQTIQAMQLTDKGKIDAEETYKVAKATFETQGKTVSEFKNGVFTVEGKYGTYTYTITEEKILKGAEGGYYKFYGTYNCYLAITPNNIILKDNEGNLLDTGESIEFETKTLEEFFNGEAFKNLTQEEQQEMQKALEDVKTQYGEIEVLLFPYVEGKLSEYPWGGIAKDSIAYIQGIVLEENEQLKKELVKKKETVEVFYYGETDFGTGVLIDKSENLLYIFLTQGNKGVFLVTGKTAYSQNEKNITVIVDGVEETIKAGAKKILVTDLVNGEGQELDNPMACFVQDNAIYIEGVDDAYNDGEINDGDKPGKIFSNDNFDLSILNIYLED